MCVVNVVGVHDEGQVCHATVRWVSRDVNVAWVQGDWAAHAGTDPVQALVDTGNPQAAVLDNQAELLVQVQAFGDGGRDILDA